MHFSAIIKLQNGENWWRHVFRKIIKNNLSSQISFEFTFKQTETTKATKNVKINNKW